jgi:4-amino-4-deoxy-L-arabinose transferase-like glycosyltransferase
MPRLLKTHRIPALLAAVIALAVVLRLFAAFYQGNEVEPLPGVYDQLSYQMLAERVVEGHGFSFPRNWWPATRADEPTAHWSFLYTLYLAVIYTIVGVHPLAPRLVQAVIAGVLHPWLTYRIGNRLFGERVGLVAALLTAAYSYFVLYASSLMTETFYLLAILWAFDILTRMAARAERRDFRALCWKTWVLLGVALGVGVLLRQVLLITVPILLAWTWWALCRREQLTTLRALLPRMILTVGIIAVFILPWTIRNYAAFDRFVLLNTNAGFAFFLSNHPIHETSFIAILGDDHPTYRELLPTELLHLDEASLDRALLGEGLRGVFDDPVRYLLLSASRTKDLFKFWPSSDSSTSSNLARILSFGVCVPFIGWGLFLSLMNRRRTFLQIVGKRSSSLNGVVLLLLFISTYSAIHLLSWSLIRYRIPMDPLLLLFASIGICHLLQVTARKPSALFEVFNSRTVSEAIRSTAAPQGEGNATE